MPKRHVPFGKKIAKELAELIDRFEAIYETTDQVIHGVKVLKEYYAIHRRANAVIGADFDCIEKFLARHDSAPSTQLHFTRESYYGCKGRPFPEFAKWRHTIRNYSSSPLDDEKIKAAVKLAVFAPSACNRQHIRVLCVVNKSACAKILELQGGNRGFGHLADKVLIVTADLRAEIGGIRERYDPYVNGGIFLMNLCYALSYCEVAYCILTYALDSDKDAKIRAIGKVPENEVVVGMLCCGEPPDEFDVAISPKRTVDEILTFVK
jgi:nitroreductase